MGTLRWPRNDGTHLGCALAAVLALVSCARGPSGEVPAAAASAAQDRIAYLVAAEDGFWQVWTIDADGTNAQPLTRSPREKSRCSWFPDGRSLLVNAQDGRVYRVDAQSGEEREVDLGVTGMLDAVLSADGEWVAFSMQRSAQDPMPSGDSNDIWIQRTTGGDLQRRAALRGLQAEPAWSRDARWLYFFSSGGFGIHQIWRVSRDGADLEQITTDPSRHLDVALSPQGHLAYSSNATGNYEIWLQRSGEPRAIALTSDPAADVRPSFSPGGDRLVFESSREGRPNLWIVPTTGGPARRLTRHAIGARSPSWWVGGAHR